MTSFAVHDFTVRDWDENAMPFSPESYSLLKFGNDETARRFGHELAESFFARFSSILLAYPTVVIPSPYNFVKNAATIMTQYFVSYLNHLLVHANGSHVDYSIIHRKVSYTNDYGFMSKEQRQNLIANDSFFLNEGFYEGKTLIFVDDIRITGTHEERLKAILRNNSRLCNNRVFYVYYGRLRGPSRPEIEAALNFASVRSLDDYMRLSKQPGHHVIVRPIKFLLGRSQTEFRQFLQSCPNSLARELYDGCLGEGYYQIPDYQDNFHLLKHKVIG